MNKIKGTPKTLYEAIENGLEDSRDLTGMVAIKTIENHVRDYLGQRFGAAMLADQSLVDLWARILEKPK